MDIVQNETHADDCQIGYLHQPHFGLLLWLTISSSTGAIVLNSMFVRVLWDFTVYHVNLRLLLVHQCAMVIWMATGILAQSSFTFFLLYTVRNPCSYFAAVNFQCKVISWLAIAHPSTALSLGSLGVGLERIYGILRYRTYHKRSKRYLWLSVLIIIFVSWIPSIVPQLYTVFGAGDNATEQSSPLCVNLLTFGRLDALITPAVYDWLHVMSCGLWIFLYVRSRQLLIMISINRAKQSLAARFQLSQNFGVVRTLSPWFVLHTAFHLTASIAQWLFVAKILNATDQKGIIAFFLINIPQSIYGIAFPLICVSRSKVLRTRLLKNVSYIKRCFKFNRRPNTIQPDTFCSEARKQSVTCNGFQMNEIKYIHGNIPEPSAKTRRDKRAERIHVFSTLE